VIDSISLGHIRLSVTARVIGTALGTWGINSCDGMAEVVLQVMHYDDTMDA